MNKIYNGDCLFVMKHDIPEESVDLIYLDPPFFTGKVQKSTWQPGAMEISYEDSKKFWGTKNAEDAPLWIKEVGVKRPAFASYLNYMLKRLELCKHVLKDTGTIYLHCDYRASHYLKIIMDRIFKQDSFRNEIIWFHPDTPGRPKRDFPRKHDTIFRYVKSKDFVFNDLDVRVEILEKSKERYKSVRVLGGREYLGGKSAEIGKIPEDVWRMAAVKGNSKEAQGYPTQKPEILLERIIKASSNPGDLVLDPFCGCGTAIAIANKLGRNWIGIDIESDACTVMKKRFENDFGIVPEIHYRNIEQVRKLSPREFEMWVNEFYKAKKPSPDRGVDGITPNGIPIQVKTMVVKYNIVDSFLNSARYHPNVPKPIKRAIIVSQKGFAVSARARVFEIKEREGIEILLVTPQDLLGDGN